MAKKRAQIALVICCGLIVSLVAYLVLHRDEPDWDRWVWKQLSMDYQPLPPPYDPGPVIIDGIDVYPVQPPYEKDRQLLFFTHIPRTAGGSFSSVLAAEFPAPERVNQSTYGFAIFRWDAVRNYPMEDWRRWRVMYTHEDMDFLRMFPAEIDVATAVFIRNPAEHRRSMYDWHMMFTHWYEYAPMDKWLGSNYYPLHYQVEWLAGCVSWWPYSKAPAHVCKRILNDQPLMLRRAKDALARTTFLGITERLDESLCLFYYSHRLPPKVEGVDWRYFHKTNRSRSPLYEERQRELLALEYDLYEWGVQLFDRRMAWMKEDFRRRPGMKKYVALHECEGVLFPRGGHLHAHEGHQDQDGPPQEPDLGLAAHGHKHR